MDAVNSPGQGPILTYKEKTEKLGQAVVSDGRLKQVQQRLQLSSNMMAEMLDVAPTTYRKWMREPGTNLWPAIAFKVGEFYRAVLAMLTELSQEGTIIDLYIPLHQVAMEIGWPQERLLAAVRAGKIHAEDFGILGLWTELTELDRLRKGRSRVAA